MNYSQLSQITKQWHTLLRAILLQASALFRSIDTLPRVYLLVAIEDEKTQRGVESD